MKNPGIAIVAKVAPATDHIPTWVQWLQLPVTAALVTGIVAIVVVLLNRWLQSDRIRADKDIAERRLDLDLKLTERRLEADLALAERRFELDRELDNWRRKVNFAEETLAEFYRAATAISVIRSPAVWGHEYERRAGRDQESPGEQRRRDQYLPYLDRINAQGEFLDSLHARRFRAIALFDAGSDEPFNRIRAVVVQIQVAAQMLLRDPGPAETEQASQHRERMLQRIWEGYEWAGEELDAIQQEIAAIVSVAERLFRPILSQKLIHVNEQAEVLAKSSS